MAVEKKRSIFSRRNTANNTPQLSPRTTQKRFLPKVYIKGVAPKSTAHSLQNSASNLHKTVSSFGKNTKSTWIQSLVTSQKAKDEQRAEVNDYISRSKLLMKVADTAAKKVPIIYPSFIEKKDKRRRQVLKNYQDIKGIELMSLKAKGIKQNDSILAKPPAVESHLN